MMFGVDSRVANLVVVGLVVICRAFELEKAKRNAVWSFARGGVEHGKAHYPVMVGLHAAFLTGCAVEPYVRETHPIPAVTVVAVVVAVLCQLMRWWILKTLGPQWNVRVIVVPGASRITGGPYRWLAHPNYVVVALEGVVLPAVHASWITAGIFTVLNAALMVVRLRVENAALSTLAAPSGSRMATP
jgi:methyltransferase